MATVDSLDIQISASVQKASQAINSLGRNLDTLAKKLKFDTSSLEKLNNLSGDNFKKLGEGIKDLSAGMKELKNVRTSDFNALAKGIEKLSTIPTGNLQTVANALTPLADGIKTLSSANFDNRNLQSLINSLTRLSNANVGSLASVDFTTLGNKIKDLATALSGADKVEQNTISMTNAIAKLAGAGANISTVTAELPRLGTTLKDFINTMSSAPILASETIAFTQAIGQLASAGSKAETVANSLQHLGDELKRFMQTMATAPNVSANVIQMTQALAQLANTGSGTGRAASSLGNAFNGANVAAIRFSSNTNVLSVSLKGLGTRLNKTLKGVKSFTSQILAAAGIMGGLYGIIRGGLKAMEISSSLTEVQNVVDTTFGDMSDKVQEFADNSIRQFGMSELSVKQFASRFQAMGTAMGISPNLIKSSNEFLNSQTKGYVGLSDSMSDVSLNLTKLTADIASFYDVEQKEVAEDLAAIYTGMTVPLRKYGLDLTQATLKEWAMKNGLDANIKSMSQAEKTMLRYKYVLANTTAAQGDFAKTANTWANQVRILKQSFEQLGSIIGTSLINAFKPLVQTLNSVLLYVIDFAEKVTEALGTIFGWKFESGGTGGIAQDWSDIADTTGEAADNIDKMKKGLRAFDELNNITSPDKSGKSDGAGGAGEGAGGGLVKTDAIWEKYKSDIDTLGKLGKYIGDALSKAMESIHWDSVYQKARNFGRGLAEFLNGLISPRLFGNIGKTIAGTLNTALHFLDSFGETFDWKNFGLSIASGINNFFSTFDFVLLASAINKWVQGVWTTIKTAVSNISWKDVWNGVKEFLNNIDLETVAIIIGALTIKKILGMHLASSALSFIGTTLSKKIAQAIAGKLGIEIAANAGIGKALATGLKTAFSGISGMGILDIGTVFGAGTLVEKLAFISKMLGGIGLVIGGIITAAKGFFDMWENGWGIVGEVVKDIGIALTAIGAVILGVAAAPAAIVAAIVAAASTIVIVVHDNWDAICEWFSGVADWINTNVIQPVIGSFQGIWTNVSGFFKNLWNDITGIWSVASGWFKSNVIEPVAGFFQGLQIRVGQIFEGLWIVTQAVWKIASGWFNENVIIPITNFFQGLWESVSGFFVRLWEDIVSVWASVSEWFDTNIITPVTDFFKGLWEDVSGFFSNLWEDIQTVWESVASWFDENIITPVQNAFETACDVIGGFFSSLWDGIKKGVVDAMNAAIGAVEGGINFIVDGINSVLSGFNNLVSAAASLVGTSWGGVDLVPTVSLLRLATGAVFRGGKPFAAIVNDQPRGQTNIEAPLKVIKQALREELTSFTDKFDAVQLTPSFEVGQFQPMPPPEFDFETRYQNSYQAAEAYWHEEERKRMESGYNSYAGSEISDDMRKELYDIVYNAIGAAMNNNRRLREMDEHITQGRVVEVDGDSIYKSVVNRAAERANYSRGKRLVIANEVF